MVDIYDITKQLYYRRKTFEFPKVSVPEIAKIVTYAAKSQNESAAKYRFFKIAKITCRQNFM